VNLASFPPHLPFLPTLASRWLASMPDPSRGMILLPTRRAARALAETFLALSGGRPMLLPRIVALGALDETPLALAGALDLPPAVDPADRMAALARMVLALPAELGGSTHLERAWRLAGELADLMDEADRAEVDLAAALPLAADAAHAEHWRITLEFLGIVTRHWPQWLADNRMMNPAARAAALLHAQARVWTENPPTEPVWAAGATGTIPSVTALLRAVARAPMGLVVLPGLDVTLDDGAWDALKDSHPQAGLRSLLASLGARRDDVVSWNGTQAAPPGRVALLQAAMLPAASLGAWRAPADPDLTGLSRLNAADAQEAALAIALVLREAVEVPGRRAALITPDRALAQRVCAELSRWGIVADDSGGEALAATPPAVFLRLLAQAVAEGLSPVPLLALLKHPLAAAGLRPAECRAAARVLELAALRGPRPPPGLDPLRRAAERAGADGKPIAALLDRLAGAIAPLLRVAAAVTAGPAEMLAALAQAGEALATTDAQPGPTRLWAEEEGEALGTALAAAHAALADLPPQPPSVLPRLLDALLDGAFVRSRRAVRGRDGALEHPRIFIWGLLEARLQSVDVAVLGGLVEGVWPGTGDPGPWLSRPMRARVGLPSPEQGVSGAAHDFAMAACCAPEIVLAAPRRRDGAPALPSRWLVRLDAYLGGLGRVLPRHPADSWAGLLDRPSGPPRPATPPRPTPPLARRPRRLSVTEIETWIADPYAIYAEHVLRLAELAPIDEATDALDYGTLVHAGLEAFLEDIGADWPPDAGQRLDAALRKALAARYLRPALAAWWEPRLGRIAAFVAGIEDERRRSAAPVALVAERKGIWTLDGTDFTLTGRADRIERRADGTLAILDYKTGNLPKLGNVREGHAPQLPLEAAMARAGAFGEDWRGEALELSYWQLTGGREPGTVCAPFDGDPDGARAATDEAERQLRRLIEDFARPARAYLCAPHPGRWARVTAYAHLARRAEWDPEAGA
jgi:ATP-dependent helicase/nuclease subunit B